MAIHQDIRMKASKLFSKPGWRRTAIFNMILTCTCDILLLIFLLVSVSQPGASFTLPTIIFEGSCTTSSRINLLLHFLINVISTAILSSSNFFMQILNAPSRQEIDRAHTWLQSLDVGIPSIRNMFHVSRLKSVSWVIFLITSLPVHLLFNSAVFETTYEGSQWHLTLATEAFTKGAPYFPPGASLTPAGTLGNFSGYGETVPLEQYWNVSSAARQKIASVAKESHSWTFLSAAQCYSEYMSYAPRKKYGDVVLILDSTSSKGGWARSDIFSFDPSTDLAMRWNTHIPPGAVNSLWFSSQCSVNRYKTIDGEDDYMNNCLGAMGIYGYEPSSRAPLPVAQDPWLLAFFPAVGQNDTTLFEHGLKFNHSFDFFVVDHCRAQPLLQPCKVGLSNELLLILIFSILVKAIQGSVIAWKLPEASLVTPGDAIQSFILYPDPVSQGLGTLDIVDEEEIEYGERRYLSNPLCYKLTTNVQPRKWKESFRRLRHIVPYRTWIKTYFIFFPGVILLTVGFAVSSVETSTHYTESFDHSNGVFSFRFWDNGRPPNYIATLLFVNTPQLIFSFCYFSYNSLLTQCHVEKEWNDFSISYRPLRVSYPVGQQVSSYRLQLPYKHSVPLITISIVFHWLTSNALFLYVNEGGYWGDNSFSLPQLNDVYSVSEGSIIALGYSPGFLLVLFVASFVFILTPPVFFAFYKMKGNMVAGGWNSLVISAACHVPNMMTDQDEQPSRSESDPNPGEDMQIDDGDAYTSVPLEDYDEHFKRLVDLTQRKLRWGATKLPRSLSESVSTGEREVFHLGFGGEEHDVSEPQNGQYYL